MKSKTFPKDGFDLSTYSGQFLANRADNYQIAKSVWQNQNAQVQATCRLRPQEKTVAGKRVTPRRIKKIADQQALTDYNRLFSHLIIQLIETNNRNDAHRDDIQDLLAHTNNADSTLGLVYPMFEELRQTIKDQTEELTHLPKANQNLIQEIAMGNIAQYLIRFFQKTEPKKSYYVSFQKMADIATMKVLYTAVMQEPMDLQEFFGQDDPKELRGQIKADFNHTFQNTDQLMQHLIRVFVLD